jgi:hypothetical protein
MNVHAQFLTVNMSGKIWEATGSEGVFILDGRNTYGTQAHDARERMKKLSKAQNFVGFVIKKGNRFSNAKPTGSFIDRSKATQKQIDKFYVENVF